MPLEVRADVKHTEGETCDAQQPAVKREGNMQTVVCLPGVLGTANRDLQLVAVAAASCLSYQICQLLISLM